MGDPRRRPKRDPAGRLELAKKMLGRHLADVSHQDLATLFRTNTRQVRSLLDLAKSQPDAPQPKPTELRSPRSWVLSLELTLTGTIGGDAMARALLSGNRTLPEPTHELQRLYEDEWECVDVGDEATMGQALERQAHLDDLPKPADVYRVVPRVPRDG